MMDITLASVGLLATAPLFALISLAVKLEDGGPVFYRGKRMGRDERPFRVLKFRSMVAEADAVGPSITRAGDPRVTRVGRWLRRFKLDELPQLLNVVSGDMSFVGPRPEAPDWVETYDRTQRTLLALRPGITSPASIAYRDEESFLTAPGSFEEIYANEILPRKLSIDLEYAKAASFLGDLRIILQTLLRILPDLRR